MMAATNANVTMITTGGSVVTAKTTGSVNETMNTIGSTTSSLAEVTSEGEVDLCEEEMSTVWGEWNQPQRARCESGEGFHRARVDERVDNLCWLGRAYRLRSYSTSYC